MDSNKNNRSSLLGCLFILLLVFTSLQIIYNVFDTLKNIRTSEYVFYDFRLRWQECAYVLRGINPFDSINGGKVLPELGKIDSVAGTMPWSYLLGNIMIPGFLPYKLALIYYNCFYVLSAVICFALLWKQTANNRFNKMAIISIPAFWCAWYAFRLGNYGTTCCFLVVVSILIYRRSLFWKIIAGVLLTIAMCKPQVAGLFFLTYLLMGEFVVPLVCLCLVGISYIAVSIITHTNAITLLSQILTQGTNYDNVNINNGLFTILRNFNISTTVILMLSLIFGIAFFIYGVKRLRENQENTFLCFLPAAICSSFWFYRNPYESMTLIIPVVIIALILATQHLTPTRGILLYFSLIGCVAGYLVFEKYGYILFNHFLKNAYLARDIALLMEDIMYIAIMFIIINIIRSSKKEHGEMYASV